MRWPLALVAAGLVACSSGSPASSVHSPTQIGGSPVAAAPTPTVTALGAGQLQASPSSPSPTAVSSPKLAVMVDLFSSVGGYDVSLVSSAGRVVARARGRLRSAISDSIELPYVSASNSRVYYLDGDQQIRWLKADGSSGTAGIVPGGAQAHAAFSVSPDDSRIAVATLDYSVSPVALTLYVGDAVGGAHRNVIFTSTNRYVWPIGWHAGQLVVAYLGPNATPFKSKVYFYTNRDLTSYPYGPNPYGGINAHVISPVNAQRLTIIGGGGNSGLFTPSGTADVQGGLVDWSGNYGWNTVNGYGSISATGSLAPDGRKIAACCWPSPTGSGELAVWSADGSSKPTGVAGTSGDWVGWFDDTHLITGFYQRKDGTVTVVDLDTGLVRSVDVYGIVAAMLPGTLDA